MFQFNPHETLSEKEERILSFWEKERIFEQSLELTKGGPLFLFYDGPPFATGLPHYGHILAGTIKDVIPRFWTMKGYFVPRYFGWDCHGLPVENEIEKAEQLSGAHSIEKFGIDRFNEACRNIVLRYTAEWEKTVLRMGRWIHFREAYKTMDKSFMEAVWAVFGNLYDKGLVYEGFKVMPFSAKLGTPLSNFEANLNYQEVDDPAIVVAFPLKDDETVSLIAWTTTPWTLPANLALAVHPDFDYVKILDRDTDKQYILAHPRVEAHFKNYEILEIFRGKLLEGKKYRPLFPYFAQREEAFTVLTDGFVSLEEGTGVVHMAPAFGEVDFFACQKAGIDMICPVDQNCRYTDEIVDFEGVFVKDADKPLIRLLKQKGLLVSAGTVRHRYPFCWRSDSPLIYKAVKTWFIAVEKIKDQLTTTNREIHWVPDHIKEGRFGNWLKQARDWAISRNRYWGTPIPIWKSDDGEIKVISTVKQLEEITGHTVLDLHRHFIDHLSFEEGGKRFHRIPEVFDCWFESGSMPYAYRPKELGEKVAPADFVGEGLDQTRGWFYTLNVISTALNHRPAFKNAVVNGTILAEDGSKMSKRLKNYPEPLPLIEKFGADSLRLYLLNSQAVVAEDLRFSAKGVEQVVKQFSIPLWNSYLFLATYAAIYSWKPNLSNPFQPKLEIDRWILSTVQKLIEKVTRSVMAYELQPATIALMEFVEQLTNWYIRRNRSRFWTDEKTADRDQAFQTLYLTLHTFIRMAAPFIPFLTEAIYLELRSKVDPISVHLCPFPVYDSTQRDLKLEHEMEAVQSLVSLGHSLRKEHKLRVRQPLQHAYVVSSNLDKLELLKRHQQLIEEELNVKTLEYGSDETAFVTLHAKPNFRVLGKRVGNRMPEFQARIEALSPHEIQMLLDGKALVFEGEDTVACTEVVIERKIKENVVAKKESDFIIALDTVLTQELLLEGIARDLVNRINTVRREAKLEVTDRIEFELNADEAVQEAFKAHRDFICNQVLALQVLVGNSYGQESGKSWEVSGYPVSIVITKVHKSKV